MKSKRKFIIKCNSLLVKHFGLPVRNRTLPDPLDLLIATILSQNTNDNNSYRAFQNLKNKFPRWENVLKAERIQIENLIRVGGLAQQKSRTIKYLLSELNKNSSMDLDFLKHLDNNIAIEQLSSFRGVGVKTASCVLLFAFNRNICPVDTHVHRTTNRIGIVSEKIPDKTFFALNKNFPDKIAHSFHTNLIRLGREICTPTKPGCGICPLLKICSYPDKNFDKKLAGRKKEFMLLDNVNK